MAAPLHDAGKLPRLPAVPLEQLTGDCEYRNLSPALGTGALGAGPRSSNLLVGTGTTGVGLVRWVRRRREGPIAIKVRAARLSKKRGFTIPDADPGQ